MNYWYSLIGILGFATGFMTCFLVTRIAKRTLLNTLTLRMSPEQYREMYDRQKLIEQLNIVTVQEIDKIRGCGTSLSPGS